MTTGTVEPEVKTEAPATTPETPVTPEVKTPEVKVEEKAPETKTDDKTILGADGKPKEEKLDVKQGAPEKYTDFTMPEGMTLDKAMLDKATVEFKALGLSQEAAQKLVTLQAESAKASTDAALKDYQTQIDGWKQKSTEMYGSKSAEEFGVAAQAIDRFGTPELRAILNETGLGNHPELVKFFVQVGHAIKEENPAEGRRVNERADDASVFYPRMKK